MMIARRVAMVGACCVRGMTEQRAKAPGGCPRAPVGSATVGTTQNQAQAVSVALVDVGTPFQK